MAVITDMVDLNIQDGIAVLKIKNPPVNALSKGVRDGLYEGVKQANADDSAKAILIICEGRTYIAGADIKEFGRPPQGTSLFDVHKEMENASKPVISTIQGTALGGGLETALCSHYRVAVTSAKFGLPEVHLGILPGAGGTQRLPRVVGVEKALDMMVGGKPVNAKFALENGLIDEIVDDLFEGGMAFAKKVAGKGEVLPKVRDYDEHLVVAKADTELFDRYRKKIARKTRGFDAPEAIIQCVEDTLRLSFDEGIKAERNRFMKLVKSQKSEAQRYYFFAERLANKIPDVPKDTPTIPVNSLGMIGAGTMGGGISMNFVSQGIPVVIVEHEQEALDRGLAVVRSNFMRGVKRGRVTEEQVDQMMSLYKPSLNLEDLADCDMIIEAVFELMDIKKEVFTKLDGIAKEGAILATNSSALDVDEIASVTKRPEWVLGTHFFSPANIMRLLEVVRAEKTSKTILATVMGLSKKIGKVPVVSGVCPGFIGNRILFKRGEQANKLILEGTMPWNVDDVVYDFGLPMGPFAMADLAGLDVGWDPRISKSQTIRDVLCENGRRGQKTGKGYYNYDPETRAKTPDEGVKELILEFSEKMGITRREFSKEEILQRCIYPMINEGARILEEGMSQRPSDIDVVWVNGYGWPTYRGGPMFYADTVGLENVLAKLKEFQEKDQDDFWQPSAMLEKLVSDGKSFRDLN